MSRTLSLAAFCATAVIASAPAGAQWQKNEYQLQKEHMAQFEPAPLLGPKRYDPSKPAVIRLRFYADDAYRAGGARWADRIKGQLKEMNRVVGPAFGVEFQGESYKRWSRQPGSPGLTAMLEELERLDPGNDVDWVVGLCAPLPMVTMSFHELGMARILGRHFVLRGMSSVAEMQEFERIFRVLEQQDREKLYGRRKAHKEMSVFLHEWAHTLGLPHVEDDQRIMSPGYSQRTSFFSVADGELLTAALTSRLNSRGAEVGGRAAHGSIDWSVLRDHVANLRSTEWLASEVNDLRRLLGQLAPAGAEPRVAGAPPTVVAGAVPVPPPPSLLGRPRVAANEALAAPPPPSPAGAQPPPEAPPPARTVPGPPSKRAAAVALLQKQEAAVTGDVTARGGKLAELATAYARQGAFSAAERTLARSGDLGSEAAPRALGEIQRLRRRFGVPAGGVGFKLDPPGELAHAEAVDQVRAALRAEQAGKAMNIVTAGLQRFPRSPGLLTLACETELFLNRPKAAVPRCKQALALMEDLPRAHYALGCAQANLGQMEPAVKSLKRALVLDPADQTAWQSLQELLGHLNRSAEYDQFAAATGRPAPPAASH